MVSKFTKQYVQHQRELTRALIDAAERNRLSDEEQPWLTGKPYYCKVCGLGHDEYMACEDGDCQLESVAEAQARRDRALGQKTTDL